jgi:hypothetical protein
MFDRAPTRSIFRRSPLPGAGIASGLSGKYARPYFRRRRHTSARPPIANMARLNGSGVANT